MVTINLLPWRELARAHAKKQLYKQLILTFLFSFLVMYAWHYFLLQQEKHLRMHVNALKYTWLHAANQKGQYTRQQDRTVLLKQQVFLQANDRAERFFSLWGKLPEDNICFTDVQRNDHVLRLVGRARSALAIDEFIQHLPTSIGLTAWRIDQLRQYKNHLLKFHIHANEIWDKA